MKKTWIVRIITSVLAYAVGMKNRKELKRDCVIGTLFVIITGTLAHFVYDWSGHNYIAGFFFPVSESTWEHMKLCFFPMLLYSLYMNRKQKDRQSCISCALPAGILTGTFAIPVLFFSYTAILGQHFLPLDIGVFIVSVLLAFAVVYRLAVSCKCRRFTGILWLAVAVLGLCFVWFTCHPRFPERLFPTIRS